MSYGMNAFCEVMDVLIVALQSVVGKHFLYLSSEFAALLQDPYYILYIVTYMYFQKLEET